MTVAVVSCVYGTDYDQFIPEWENALKNLTRPADEIILHHGERLPDEEYPQARLLNEAVLQATSEWIWKLDVDDLALPDALDLIDYVASDVWLMGYVHSVDGEYVPPALPNDQYLASSKNTYPSMSAFRREAFLEVGGYPLIGHEDWGLWRRMARANCAFESSGRVHCMYRRHPQSRTETEFSQDARVVLMREVMDDG